MTTSANYKESYHHGDLRRRLIEVGEQLLEERGVDGFTLRECARRAGVSPSAPAHHFGSVTGLLTAIATVGFEGLADVEEAALVGAGTSPRARLKAIGEAYIRYAVAHPARFRVAFGDLPLDKTDPSLRAAGGRALGILRRELAKRRGDQTSETGDPAFTAALAFAWSTVHGFARLMVDGHLTAIDGKLDLDALLGSIADGVLELVVRAFQGDRAPKARTTRPKR